MPAFSGPHVFSGPLPPPQFNMAAYAIGRAVRATPDKIALEVIDHIDAASPSEIWTYRDLEWAVLAIAHGLTHRGLVRGDRLLIRLDNTSAYALLFFGAIAGGLVPIPASSQLTDSEAAFLLENSGAAASRLQPQHPTPHAQPTSSHSPPPTSPP